MTTLPTPDPPAGITADQGTTFNSVGANWAASSNATFYQLYRGPTAAFETASLIATTSSNQQVDGAADVGIDLARQMSGSTTTGWSRATRKA